MKANTKTKPAKSASAAILKLPRPPKVKPEWKAEEVEAFAVPKTTTVWKTQISTSPDNKEFLGIRKFSRMNTGTEQTTNAGFTIPNDANGIKLMRKLGNMMLRLAEEAKTRALM